MKLTLQGKIMDGWNVSLGYDYLSSGTTKTVAGGPPLGFPLPFTPHNNVKFWTHLSAPAGNLRSAAAANMSARVMPRPPRRSSRRPAI